MRVGRHRIDFDAEALKRFILVGEVFELGRADEGEVGGIEDENRQLARNIGVRDGDELALMVRGGDERFDGTSDAPHGSVFPWFAALQNDLQVQAMKSGARTAAQLSWSTYQLHRQKR